MGLFGRRRRNVITEHFGELKQDGHMSNRTKLIVNAHLTTVIERTAMAQRQILNGDPELARAYMRIAEGQLRVALNRRAGDGGP